MEKQYPWQKDILNIEKITDESETGFVSVEIDTSTHFMRYDAGRYIK